MGLIGAGRRWIDQDCDLWVAFRFRVTHFDGQALSVFFTVLIRRRHSHQMEQPFFRLLPRMARIVHNFQ